MKRTLRLLGLGLLLIPLILSGTQATAQWTAVGAGAVSSGYSDHPTVAISTSGIPYVVYIDGDHNSAATVKKYDVATTSWVTVGSAGFTSSNIHLTSIAIDGSGTPYIAYASSGFMSGKANVMKYDVATTSWVAVGAVDFSGNDVDYLSIAIDGSGTPYVVYQDQSISDLVVQTYDAATTSWITVGTAGFTGNYAASSTIAISSTGIPYVAFSGSTGMANVMKYDVATTSWVAVGASNFSPNYVSGNDMDIAVDGNNVPYVTYLDGGNNDNAIVQKYDAATTSWITVGNTGFSGANAYYPSITISSNGTPYIGYRDGVNGYSPAVAKYNAATTSWDKLGNASASTSSTNGMSIAVDGSGTPYVVFVDNPNNSIATVMSFVSTPLPVGLTEFSAQRINDKDVRMNWSVATPKDGKTYVVERSGDGKSFDTIGSVVASAEHNYSLHDYQPLSGNSYYRLRVVEVDSKVSYSQIQNVFIGTRGSTSVYPSPAKDYVIIKTNDAEVTTATISDMLGSTVINVTVKSGERINVSKLVPGVYLLKTNDGQSFKITKE